MAGGSLANRDSSGPEPNDDGVSAASFRASFGEDLRSALDLNTWRSGEDLTAIYGRLATEVEEAIRQEDGVLRRIRAEIFPRLADYPGAPPAAGVRQARRETLEKIHRGLLFNGGVEACDGTRQLHDTLPLTIFQLGVSLVSYQGDQGTWSQRLFRRDLRAATDGALDEVLDLLRRRGRRGGLNQPEPRDQLTELAQRGILAYAERAILLHRSNAPWRLGHGTPAPYELLTGSGTMDLMVESTKLIRELIEGHQRFVFVASEPADRVLLTIGQALRPLEYAIVHRLSDWIAPLIDQGHFRGAVTADLTWDGERLSRPAEWIARFRDRVASRAVVGVYRATHLAPAQVFFAHADHADLAAQLALADSILQEQRGFPLLIDLAHAVCGRVFGRDSLTGPVSIAYTRAGAPWRYETERTSRG